MSSRRLSRNARAVVTGAGGGIGRAFALELHRRGGRVLCSDINEQAAEETARMIRAAGGQALAVQCDVARFEAVRGLAEHAEAWFGEPADLLVNNAGVGIGGHCVEEISLEDWQWVMNINLWGVIHGCHAFLPAMKAGGRGGVINVASAAGFGVAPMMGAYNTTKAAVMALSETLHGENYGTGVNVTVLCPTLVKTDIIRDARMKPSGAGALVERDRAQALMDRIGHSPESVVRKTLDGLDRNHIHVLPQLDARAAWRFKRLSPEAFIRLSGFMHRRMNPHIRARRTGQAIEEE